MKLRVVVPVIGSQFNDRTLQEASSFAGPGTEVDVVSLDHGAESIESFYDEALVGPDILRKVEAAADEGKDAVYISCFGDPAVAAAREIVDIPVVGGFEPAVLTALGLAHRFSIVTMLKNVVPLIWQRARQFGIAERISSVRVIDTPVLELDDREALEAKLLREMRVAAEQEGAEAVVLGCTGMLGVAAVLQDALSEEGPFTPVIDPTGAAVAWLESQVRLGLRQSRRAYMPPPLKLRNA